MRLTVFSDLHVHNYKNFDSNGSRLDNCLNVLDDVFKFSEKNKIKYILFCGDIVDQQQAVPTVAGNALVLRLSELFSQYENIVMLAISGNHDQASKSLFKNEGESYLKLLSFVFPERFILVDNKSVVLDDNDGAINILGLPYYSHPEHYTLALKEITEQVKTGMKSVLLIHQTPTGLGNPNIPTDTDVNDPIYDAYNLILCGHIHQPQDILNKFVVVGSPLHRDLGDEGDEKGFWVFDTVDPADTLTFISRKGRYPEFKRSTIDDGSGDYIIPIIEIEDNSSAEAAEMEKFSTTLSAAELMENYFNQSDKSSDKEYLKTGLEFIY
jgi:DNA repair exonuclease SbcCD nuclease subunit